MAFSQSGVTIFKATFIMKKSLLILTILISICKLSFALNQVANPNSSNAPVTSTYQSLNGNIGTSQSVNGGTVYYQNGKYQGQTSSKNSNWYYDQSGKIQQISPGSSIK